MAAPVTTAFNQPFRLGCQSPAAVRVPVLNTTMQEPVLSRQYTARTGS